MKEAIYGLVISLMLLNVVACKDQKQISTSEPMPEQSDSTVTSKATTPTIVPGERLDGIVLGERATEILDSLGHPESGDAAMGKALSTWTVKDANGDASLSLFTSTKMGVEAFSRIQQIRTTSTMYKDEHHLGVGDSLSAIKSNYTLKKVGTFEENGRSYDLYESPKGIAFEVDSEGLVHGIIIHKPNHQATSTYLPFYKDFKPSQK